MVPAKIPRSRRCAGLMLDLAVADLFHARIINLCVMLALTAVLAPLMILLGLKHGIIQVMRERLIEDPRNREIRPVSSISLEHEWFEEIRKDPRVGFVIPMTRRIAAAVSFRPADVDNRADVETVRADLIPTAPGDALLTENRAVIPGEGQCVLSAVAAEDGAVKVGDTIEVLVSRLVGERTETVTGKLSVVAIADPRASGLHVVFTPLEFIEQVERYKDGLAVSELGWDGSLPEAYPVYDGAAFVADQQLPRDRELGLVIDTGFTRIERINHSELRERDLTYLAPEDSQVIYLLMTQSSAVSESAISNLSREVERIGAKRPSPWIRPIDAKVIRKDGGDDLELELILVPDFGEESLDPVPPKRMKVALPPTIGVSDGDELDISINTPSGPLRFSAIAFIANGEFRPGTVAVPPRLAGILRLAQTRSIAFEPDLGKFILARRGYSSFRLYARTIDDVPLLAAAFEDHQISVFTESARIRDVLEIDTYATYVFFLISFVGIVGSTAALMASLYAAAERSRKELSVLRLLGLTRLSLFRFPVYQAVILVTFSIGLAVTFFFGVAAVINHFFRPLLSPGESVCQLPPIYIVVAWGGGIAFAALASIFAAARIASIDPSEALRDE